MRHVGRMVRDERQLEEVRQKLTRTYGIEPSAAGRSAARGSRRPRTKARC
jgi:hypothetical protein